MSLARFRVVCIAVVLRLSVAVPAIDLMGPPTATHKVLQVSLGLEYSYSEENVKLTDQGSIPLDGLSDVERNTSSGNLGVGLLDDLELFFRVGAQTLQANELDFDGNTDPLLGAGTKVTFYRGERIDIGALFQWSTFEGDETGFIDILGFNALEEIRIDEHLFAVGATVDMDGWRLYGGPLYYVFDGDVTITEIADPTRKIRADVEEESEFGGYIGGQLDLGAMGFLTVEYVHTGEAWGVGIGLSRMF